jgi:hypothetical protein
MEMRGWKWEGNRGVQSIRRDNSIGTVHCASIGHHCQLTRFYSEHTIVLSEISLNLRDCTLSPDLFVEDRVEWSELHYRTYVLLHSAYLSQWARPDPLRSVLRSARSNHADSTQRYIVMRVPGV